MRTIFVTIIVFLHLISCSSKSEVGGNPAVAKIGDNVLFKDEVLACIPDGLSEEDSLIMAEHYIKTWIDDILLYKVAIENISGLEEIDNLTEEYRRSLVIYRYQEELADKNMPKEKNLDEQVLQEFYENNSDMFVLDKLLLKGVLIKIPTKSKKISYVRYWCRSLGASRAKLEDYCNNDNDVYSYFIDEWTDYKIFAGDGWDFQPDSIQKALKYKKYIERQSDGNSYILGISDVLLQGETAPFEYVKPIVWEMVMNKKKIEFLDKTREELYEKAIGKGEVKFFNE